jgi:membrane protein
MRIDHTAPSSTVTKMVVGAVLTLGLTVYRIVAGRHVTVRSVPQEPAQAGSAAIARRDWVGLSERIVRNVLRNQLTFVAAGVAFYAFLAIPAALAVLASLSLLIWDSGTIQRGLQPLAHVIPSYAMKLLSDPHSRQTLGIGLLVTLIIDAWSALSGGACMLKALKLIHGEKSKPSFIHRQMAVLSLAAITIPFMLVSLVLLGLPAIIELVPLSPSAKTAISIARWPILLGLFMAELAVAYSRAPHRAGQHWRWASLGTIVAMTVWIVVSAGLSVFATEFVPYDQSYGTIGSIIGLLIWLNFTAFMILLGAQIDAEIEREPEPVGAADPGARAEAAPLSSHAREQ